MIKYEIMIAGRACLKGNIKLCSSLAILQHKLAKSHHEWVVLDWAGPQDILVFGASVKLKLSILELTFLRFSELWARFSTFLYLSMLIWWCECDILYIVYVEMQSCNGTALISTMGGLLLKPTNQVGP